MTFNMPQVFNNARFQRLCQTEQCCLAWQGVTEDCGLCWGVTQEIGSEMVHNSIVTD